jgi:5-methylcytosine-specific restriction endonuclease McrA
MSSNDRNYRRMIQRKEWQQLRRWKLSEYPLCEDCYAKGYAEHAVEVHHVTPVEQALSVAEMQRLMFAPDNLVSLCHTCHVARHTAMKSKSKQVIRERERMKLERFRERFLT